MVHATTSRGVVCALAVLVCWTALAQDQPPPPVATTLRITLTEALQRVLDRHPDVRSAGEAILRAQAQARVAQARRWPQLSAEAGAAATKTLARHSSQSSHDASLALSYELFATTRDREIKRTEVQAQAQQYGLPDAQRQLAFEVRGAYYDILATRQLARAMMQSLAAAERHRQMVEARIKEGSAPESDLLPVLVEVAQARLQAVQAETSLEVAQATLRSLLEVPPGTELELDPAMPTPEYAGDLAGLLQYARQARPDVRQQELSVQAAQLAAAVARAQAGVQLNATAAADYGHHTDDTGDAWQVQVGATYPLFDAGASRASARSAAASEQIERQRLESLLLQVQQQVEAAHWQARQAVVSWDTATVARRDAETSLAAAEARYAEGLAIIIEVTDAQVQLLQAQVAEVQARLNFAAALASLDLATGAAPLPAERP
jgi:outer membrane protein TolC